MPDREREQISLSLEGEELSYTFGIAGEENAILPFHFDMEGIELIQATAQPVTSIAPGGEQTYVFFVSEGMQAAYVFENGVKINGEAVNTYSCKENLEAELFTIEKNGTRMKVLTLSRKMADRMFLVSAERLVFTDAALLEDADGIRLETTSASNEVMTYPADVFRKAEGAVRLNGHPLSSVLGCYRFDTKELQVTLMVNKIGPGRYTIAFPHAFMKGMKDALLQLDYHGDIGHAFLDGRMIHDNFCNGAVWEIGLKEFADELRETPLTVYITPLKEGVKVNVESAMAARAEEVQRYIAELKSVKVRPVYEIKIFP